jgi:ABC-type uncharacterized transport system permease subunit
VERVAYWVLGAFGGAMLALANVFAQAGSIVYSEKTVDTAAGDVAFVALLVLAGLAFVGIAMARARPNVAVWLIRVSGLGAVVAGVYAITQSHPITGFGLLIVAALPLLLAASFVGWAER